GNVVRNAYNGIRMVVTKGKGGKQKCLDISSCWKNVNQDVQIQNNLFAYVRDNPVEPEARAVNWRVFDNQFFNSYALISTDGVSGGPFYVWGNRGWLDRSQHGLPGESCTDKPDWLNSQAFDF